MVSHELRTPLNAIIGWSAILSERPDPASERGLKVIRRNAQALLKLVEELLDAARLTAETISIQESTIKLREVVCSAVDAVKPAADLKGVELRTTTLPEALPLITGDPDRLRQEAHRLRGTSGSFGLARISALAGALEDRAAQGEIVIELVSELERAAAAAHQSSLAVS